MADAPMLRERLLTLGIDSNTRHNLNLLRPGLAVHIDEIVAGFYSHFLQFDSAAALLPAGIAPRLRQRQRAHWIEMFECRFDEHYTSNAVRIGQAHFDHKVPPRLYLAGHSYFHCRIIEMAARKYGQSGHLPILLASVAKVIALDIDLALSAYTRAMWREPPANDLASVWL